MKLTQSNYKLIEEYLHMYSLIKPYITIITKIKTPINSMLTKNFKVSSCSELTDDIVCIIYNNKSLTQLCIVIFEEAKF